MFLTVDDQNLPHQKFLFTRSTTVFTGTYVHGENKAEKLNICREIVLGSSQLVQNKLHISKTKLPFAIWVT